VTSIICVVTASNITDAFTFYNNTYLDDEMQNSTQYEMPNSASYNSAYIKNIQYVINQWQDMYYDGSVMTPYGDESYVVTLANTDPLILVPLVIVNLSQNISEQSSRQLISQMTFKTLGLVSIPIILHYDKILILKSQSLDDATVISYKQILGDNSVIVNKRFVCERLLDLWMLIQQWILYVSFPATLFLNIVSLILDRALVIITMYFIVNFWVSQTPIQTVVRMVMFSSSVPMLLSPLALFGAKFVAVFNAIQTFANIVMVYGIVKMKVVKSK
jgi:hypothetical protein